MKLNNSKDVLNALNFQVTPEQMAKLQIVPREDDPNTWIDNDPE
jgi:hypothetical protein